jgi:hypothetical protein
MSKNHRPLREGDALVNKSESVGYDRLKLTLSAKQDISPRTMCEFMVLRTADYGLRCMRFRYGFTAAGYFDDLK